MVNPLYPAAPIRDRFMRHVVIPKEVDQCWEWVGAKLPSGHGRLGLGGHTRAGYAHRISYELHIGAIPAGLCICHKCDNPSCVNPQHLFAGTQQDNVTDMIKKGRQAPVALTRRIGEQHGGAKLTDEAVIEIRDQHRKGVSRAELASRFGVTPTTVWRVVRRLAWTHIEEPMS